MTDNQTKFEINGQPFFLNFVPEEGRWFVFAPTQFGMQRMPVADDSPMHFDKFVFMPMPEGTDAT